MEAGRAEAVEAAPAANSRILNFIEPGEGVRLIRCAARPRLLLIAPYSSYRTTPYISAAEQEGVDVFLVSGKSSLDLPSNVPGMSVDFDQPDKALGLIRQQLAAQPVSAVLPTDDSTTGFAAHLAREFNLIANRPEPIALTRDKYQARKRLRAANINCPEFELVDLRETIESYELPGFPVVIKPLSMSASRGVIRADGTVQLIDAMGRIKKLLEREYPNPRYDVLVEKYIPGFEVAIEGMLVAGALQILAIFDKPDPLPGPYFEETYYTTPTRLGSTNVDRLTETMSCVCAAYGLTEGPVHAEFRVNESGVWPIELAARTIGGKCARLIHIATGYTLERLVVRHALGERLESIDMVGGAAVLMMPVPKTGVVRRVEGIGRARAVPDVEQVEIDVSTGQVISAWPEGGSYPGFLFSRSTSPYEAEQALRRACSMIDIVVAPLLVTS